jgi:short-subunit dehydrogenase
LRAREPGASLAGRTRAKLEALERDIAAADGNVANIAQVDTLDAQAVQRHAAQWVDKTGDVEICFNL